MSSFAGTRHLLRLYLRRDRIVAPAWVLLLVALLAGTVRSYAGLLPTAADRLSFVADIGANRALSAFAGPMYSAELGALVHWKIGDIAYTLIALFTILTVVRHTRGEEESGRLELVRATVVGRYASLTAGLTLALGLGVLAAGLGAAAMIGGGLPVGGSVAFGLAIAAPAFVFGAVAALAAQLAERARTANVIACAVLGGAYVVRFVADGGAIGWLRWASPLGWSHLVEPYGTNRTWILLLPLAIAVALGVAAYVLQGARDLGEGTLPSGPGAAEAPKLGTPLALAWRLQRGQLLGWLGAFAIAGAAFASVASGMPNDASRSGEALEFFQRYAATPDATIADSYLWLIVLSLGYIAAIYPMLAVLRLRAEESSGRGELTLGASMSRLRWAGSHLLIAMAGTVLILAAAGLTAGLAHGLATGDGTQVPRLLGATLVQVPAAWTLGAVSALAFGLLPQLAVAISWTAWAVTNLFGEVLGPAIGIDYWIANVVVPFHHLPKVLSGGTFTVLPLLILAGVSAAGMLVGLFAFRRRDLV